MNQHWKFREDCLELRKMPFYWRLKDSFENETKVTECMPIRISADKEKDYLKYEPSKEEGEALSLAYKQDQNIGFLKPGSGQIETYGTSVNNFFLDAVCKYKPARIYEIGCGAGFSIKFLAKNGWHVTGIDPSEYSKKWSQKAGFELINDFFNPHDLPDVPDFIFCNDVFEHLENVEEFSSSIFCSLSKGGIFCFCTTNSTNSIKLGDISMLEHQHVNMFTKRSIYEILTCAGFSEINVMAGSYGNTFHVVARKSGNMIPIKLPSRSVDEYFQRVKTCIEGFAKFYGSCETLLGYVPLRCIPYLASVGDYGTTRLFDSNLSWRGKFIDGYQQSIGSLKDAKYSPGAGIFIGSDTFYDEIKSDLICNDWPEDRIIGVRDLI